MTTDQGWTRSCRGRTRSCLVPGTIDFEAPTGTTDWDPVLWRGTTGNDRCGMSNFRGTTEKVGCAARPRTGSLKRHKLTTIKIQLYLKIIQPKEFFILTQVT